MNNLITRQEYLKDSTNLHHKYHLQFATKRMIEQVKNYIGIDRIKNSKDEHLNDIPIEEWDNMGGFKFAHGQIVMKPFSIEKELSDKLNEAGEDFSSATSVCIYKAIARDLIK